MSFDTSILGALVPIFIVILAGYLFRIARFPGDEFWPYAERITYFVLFPALLLQKTATAPIDLKAFLPTAAVLYASILAMAGLVLLLRPWRRYGTKAFTSFFQGSIRFNSYVGLAAAFALFGDKGLTLAAVVMAVIIPLTNVLCVTVLVAFADTGNKNWRTVASGIIRNPLILSCIAGLFLNLSGIGLNAGVSDTLLLFGRASLPIGLMALGAGLDIAAARSTGTVLFLSCLLKLILLPALMWTASQALDIGRMAAAVAVLFAALPGAPTSFILARQYGGDSRLMANIITVQVLVSMITLPVILTMIV